MSITPKQNGLPIFQLNTTKNLAARYMLEARKLAEADGRDYVAQREALQRWRHEHLEPAFGYFRNPFGKFLLSLSTGEAHDEYPLRVHDIAGFHRLVKLGFEVRKQGIADAAIPAFIGRHAWAAHPVSGEPFSWDPAKRELVMTPLAEANKDRRFRVPVK